MFNVNARWDRPLPQDDLDGGEPIEVGVSFKIDKFFPIWFVLSGGKHIIKKVPFVWKKSKGRNLFYIFSVIDEHNALYKLCFNRQSLRWQLVTDE